MAARRKRAPAKKPKPRKVKVCVEDSFEMRLLEIDRVMKEMEKKMAGFREIKFEKIPA